MSDETLLKFPCSFPIKAMGPAGVSLDATVTAIVRRHAPDLGEGAISVKPSKGGRYESVTVTIQATSKDQLDAIYQDLTACEQVLYAL